MTNEVDGIAIEKILDEVDRCLEESGLRGLSSSQRAVTHGCLINPRWQYKQMAQELAQQGLGRYQWTTLKNDLYLVRKQLSKALDRSPSSLSKKKLRSELVMLYRQRQAEMLAVAAERSSTAPADAAADDGSNVSSPNQASGTSNVSSRVLAAFRPYVEHLAGQISQGQRRVICISGPPRTGKTTLVQVLREQVQAHFDAIIDCRATSCPSLEDLCRHLVEQGVALAEGPPEQVLLRLLQEQHLLLIIDRCDDLQIPQQLAGTFTPMAIGYERWLRNLLEEPRLSGALIWVTRETPVLLERTTPVSVHYAVPSLAAAAVVEVLEPDIPLPYRSAWQRFSVLCGGYPELIRDAAQQFIQRPGPSLAEFLQPPVYSVVMQGYYSEVFQRLSPAETTLARGLQQLPPEQRHIQDLRVPLLTTRQLLDALSSLERRGLLAPDADGYYHLQPPILKQTVMRQMAGQLERELKAGETQLLDHYPLVQSQAPTWRQEHQRRFLLNPLLEFVGKTWPTPSQQRQFIQQRIDALKSLEAYSYGLGNLLTLAAALKVPLAELDIAGTVVRQADLSNADLSHADARGCWFQSTQLPLPLEPPLETVLCPDGSRLMVGDRLGRLLCWQRSHGTYQLHCTALLPAPVSALSFPERDFVVVAAGECVYEWLLEQRPQPRAVFSVSKTVTSLAAFRNRYIAAGLISGQIALWNSRLGHLENPMTAHTSAVRQLMFSASSRRLSSIGGGNRVLKWTLDWGSEALVFDKEIPPSARVDLLMASWQGEDLQVANVSGPRILLQQDRPQEPQPPQPLAVENAEEFDVTTVGFSANGRYLAGRDQEGCGCVWDLQHGQPPVTIHLPDYPVQLQVSDDGRWLLGHFRTVSPFARVWDLQHLEPVWSCDRIQGSCQGLKLSGAQGLAPLENLLESLGAQLTA